MKKDKKGLQKFTDLDRKIDQLLEKEQVTKEDADALTAVERERFNAILTEKLNGLKGDARDEFLHKIDLILPGSTRNQLWEYNHTRITAAISNLMQEYNVMPSKNSLAEETGLSRQTINKHIKEYRNNPMYELEMSQFKFLTSKVLAKVFRFAVNGDIRAAKLYFEMVGALEVTPANTIIKEQNNYIQINNTVLSQETIKLLSAEQLERIEEIVKGVMLPERLR